MDNYMVICVKDKNINFHELITNYFRYFCDFCVTEKTPFFQNSVEIKNIFTQISLKFAENSKRFFNIWGFLLRSKMFIPLFFCVF